ncbi:MAG: hypothetical protein U1E60_14665 [Reyranellaceae bacterium]
MSEHDDMHVYDKAGFAADETKVVDLAERRSPRATRDATPDDDGEVGDSDADLFWSGDANDPANELYRANNRREAALYPGDLLPLKRALQRAGYGVWWVKPGKRINVGDRVMSVDEFRDMARRVRREARLAAKAAA